MPDLAMSLAPAPVDRDGAQGGFDVAMALNPLAGGSAAGTIYLMEAADSVTGTVYRWTATSLTAGFAGTGYPGPNAPTNIAVSAVI